MPECEYCGDEFEDEKDLHLHWGDEHEEELNSHDQEKVKKAERKVEEQKEKELQKKKRYAGYGLGVALVLILVGFVGAQVMQNTGTSGPKTSFDLEGQPMIGEADAPVTVVEFGDYSCPHCARFEFGAFQKLKKNFIEDGDVKFYFVNFAFLGPESTKASVASECVYRQDSSQFWKYHESIFENQKDGFDTDSLVQIARDNTEGLDYEELRTCIDNRESIGDVRSDRQLGQSKGVSSTPTVYVDGRKVNNWQYSNLAQQINKALEE